MLNSKSPRFHQISDSQQNAQSNDGNLGWGGFPHNMGRVPRINAYGMLELTCGDHQRKHDKRYSGDTHD